MHRFRTSFALGALCAVLVPTLAAPAGAADSVRLRYRLDPQARYEQKMNMSTTMHVEIEGLPEDKASMLGALLGQDMLQQLAMTLTLDTGEKAKDGSVPFEASIGNLDGSITMGENKMPMPKLEQDVSFKGKLGPDGRMLELDTTGLDALAEVMPTDVVNKLMQMTPTFPEGKLAIGESLTIPQTYQMPIPGMGGEELKIEGATVFTLRSIAPEASTFDVETNVAVSSAGGESGAQMDLSLGGGGRGTATFDPRAGLFSRITIDMDIQMAMNLPAEVAQAEGAGAQPLKLNMTMKGPVEVTMGRVER
jgi:hypothetical protein